MKFIKKLFTPIILLFYSIVGLVGTGLAIFLYLLVGAFGIYLTVLIAVILYRLF